ncbi:MAG TPA: GNAT family N-acetyltransferase [Verrucomicrobiae bacterium]|nr:GNAT family N-acetyltransferase [Verrucomicrobiae bacterium]
MTLTAPDTVCLVRIEKDGALPNLRNIPGNVQGIGRAWARFYKRVGYCPPWVAYVAMDGEQIVGTCAFKSPLKDGTVEIFYATFAECQDVGYATAMVNRLVEIARSSSGPVAITAQTLPERNASTRVLAKAGFLYIGDVVHPELGLLWEWRSL